MPWFPDFVGAVELARRDTQNESRADPVAQYLRALEEGQSQLLEEVWPGRIVVYDPRAGEIRGHRALQHFVRRNKAWMAEREARTETVATIRSGSRAVVELLAHLTYDGRDISWPVAVAAESRDDRSVVFRTYCSTLPFDGHRQVRRPILGPGNQHPHDVVGIFQSALATGDVDGVVQTFIPDGYIREPIGPDSLHRGSEALRAYLDECFTDGGGIELQSCEVTDDGGRCALEYNLVRWGPHHVPPQAGIAVFDRGESGRLAAVRLYDDVERPVVPGR